MLAQQRLVKLRIIHISFMHCLRMCGCFLILTSSLIWAGRTNFQIKQQYKSNLHKTQPCIRKTWYKPCTCIQALLVAHACIIYFMESYLAVKQADGFNSQLCIPVFICPPGAVNTSICHPTQGKTQMFRRDLSEAQFQAVMKNPRVKCPGQANHIKKKWGPYPGSITSSCCVSASEARDQAYWLSFWNTCKSGAGLAMNWILTIKGTQALHCDEIIAQWLGNHDVKV